MAHDTPDKSGDELDPEEPRTPLWLPLLGVGLFLAAIIWIAATKSAPEAEAATPVASESPTPSAAPSAEN